LNIYKDYTFEKSSSQLISSFIISYLSSSLINNQELVFSFLTKFPFLFSKLIGQHIFSQFQQYYRIKSFYPMIQTLLQYEQIIVLDLIPVIASYQKSNTPINLFQQSASLLFTSSNQETEFHNIFCSSFLFSTSFWNRN
jgi:hypothetical protein